MKKLFTIAITSVLLLTGCMLIGCATTPGGERDIRPIVKTAAYFGTYYALKEHPEWRPGFEIALNELHLLEQSETIDFTTVLSIVNRLPVKELKSDDATLIITGATILLIEYGNVAIPIEQAEQTRAIVTALREGLKLGLN